MKKITLLIIMAVCTFGFAQDCPNPPPGDCSITDDTTGEPIWDRPQQGGNGLSGTITPYDILGPFEIGVSGDFTFTNTYETGYDGFMFIYSNCFDPEDPLTNFVAGDDDFNGTGQSQLLLVPLTAGTSYYIVTSGFNEDDFGEYTFAFTEGPQGSSFACDPTPPHDLIENAIDVDQLGTPFTDLNVNFVAATGDDVTSGGCGTELPFVWYKYTATSNGTLTGTISTPPTNGVNAVYIYTAPNESATLTDITFVTEDSNPCADGSTSSVTAMAGQTYYIGIDTNNQVRSDVVIDFTGGTPPNDLIENAIDVDEIGFPFIDPAVDFPNATGDVIPNDSGCGTSGNPITAVWYKFTAIAEGTATATITTPATDNSNAIVVFYNTPNENATVDDLILENSGTNECPNQITTSIETTVGQTYYLLVINIDTVSDVTIDLETLSIDDNVIEGFSFYPNPVEDVINIQSTQTVDQVILYNLAGQKVVDQKINTTDTQLSVGNLKTGIYLMTVTFGESTSTYKVIKK